MLILADNRLPQQALDNLQKLGEVVRIATSGITYPEISGHPDIFFCKTPRGLIYATNTPGEIIEKIKSKGIKLIRGNKPAGSRYPESAHYNAFTGKGIWVHNNEITDPVLKDSLEGLEAIHVKQGYTRCNLVEAGGLYITGDKGIEKVLKSKGLETFLVKQEGIILGGFRNGFFGGCTGVFNNTLVISGSLHYLENGYLLSEELKSRGTQLISLYEGPLFDAGSIIFLEQE